MKCIFYFSKKSKMASTWLIINSYDVKSPLSNMTYINARYVFHPFTVTGLVSLHYCVIIIRFYLFPQTTCLAKQIKQILSRFNRIDSAPRQWQSNHNLKKYIYPLVFFNFINSERKNLGWIEVQQKSTCN